MNGPSLFRCPLCGSPLTQEERGCICPARHSFDRAAAGYVHLLPPNRMHSKAPGDDREMVAARAAFLERGYYAPLRQALEELYPGKKIYFLVGVLEDKDYHSMVGQLLSLAKAFITITPDSQRALQAQALADYLRGEGAEAHSCETVQQGMEKALSMAGPEDVVCVCGSLYMIGEARHVLGLC